MSAILPPIDRENDVAFAPAGLHADCEGSAAPLVRGEAHDDHVVRRVREYLPDAFHGVARAGHRGRRGIEIQVAAAMASGRGSRGAQLTGFRESSGREQCYTITSFLVD